MTTCQKCTFDDQNTLIYEIISELPWFSCGTLKDLIELTLFPFLQGFTFWLTPQLSIPVGLLNPLLGISPSHSFPEGSVPSVLEGEVRLAHLDWLDNMDNTSSHVFKALASLMEVELKQLLDKDKLHLHHMEEEKLQIHHHRMNHSNVRVIVTQLLPGSVIFR